MVIFKRSRSSFQARLNSEPLNECDLNLRHLCAHVQAKLGKEIS